MPKQPWPRCFLCPDPSPILDSLSLLPLSPLESHLVCDLAVGRKGWPSPVGWWYLSPGALSAPGRTTAPSFASHSQAGQCIPSPLLAILPLFPSPPSPKRSCRAPGVLASTCLWGFIRARAPCAKWLWRGSLSCAGLEMNCGSQSSAPPCHKQGLLGDLNKPPPSTFLTSLTLK